MTKKMRIYDIKEKKKTKKKEQKNVKSAKKKKEKKGEQLGEGSQTSKENSEDFDEYTEIIGLKDLEKSVLEYIVGQDEQVRQIITSIYRALVFQTIKSNVLVIGNSGTGKTATIKQIAQFLGLPCTIEDATKYTQEGYYGSDVSEMIYNLIESADNDIAKAWNGIIVIDEIDKKAGSGEQNDVAGVEVLKSLLKIIEGTTIMVPPPDFMGDPIPFDTQNLIIIFMGAFPGLSKIRDMRLNRNTFGFARNEVYHPEKSRYLKQDLIKYGLPEEFMGRIDTIIEMNDLGYKDLVKILKKSKLSIFKKYEIELKMIGVSLVYDDDLFKSIAKASLELDTGARELTNTVNYIFDHITYEVLSNPTKYSKCILLPGIVEDNTKYELS